MDVVEVVAAVERLAMEAEDEATRERLRHVVSTLVDIAAPMLARRTSERVIEMQRAARASLNGGE